MEDKNIEERRREETKQDKMIRGEERNGGIEEEKSKRKKSKEKEGEEKHKRDRRRKIKAKKEGRRKKTGEEKRIKPSGCFPHEHSWVRQGAASQGYSTKGEKRRCFGPTETHKASVFTHTHTHTHTHTVIISSLKDK